MKFKIERSSFIEGIKTVQNIVSGKGALPVLQNVLIESVDGEKGIRLTTTDLDISVQSELSCELLEGGSTTLPVKLLFNLLLKASEGVVEVDVDAQEKATIVAGTARFRLQGIDAALFPSFKKEEETSLYTIPRQTFQEMIRKTAYAASQDDTRRTLKGVLISFKDSKMTMVATDGRRLALVEREMEIPKINEHDIVLPAKTVVELQRSLTGDGDVKIGIRNAQICFEFGNQKIYSKLIEEAYPNYLQVIPQECKEKIAVDRTQLLAAIERASVMTMDEAHSIRLIFEGNMLTVTSASSEAGDAKDEVPIKYGGEKIEIMFNPGYVMDPLKALDDDEITINVNNGHSPAVIRCSIPFLYVLMPLRIS